MIRRHRPRPSARSCRADVDAVLARGMAKRPDDRYPTSEAFALALARRSACESRSRTRSRRRRHRTGGRSRRLTLTLGLASSPSSPSASSASRSSAAGRCRPCIDRAPSRARSDPSTSAACLAFGFADRATPSHPARVEPHPVAAAGERARSAYAVTARAPDDAAGTIRQAACARGLPHARGHRAGCRRGVLVAAT